MSFICKVNFEISSGMICVLVLGISHAAETLLQVGLDNPVNTAASTRKRRPATWLQQPYNPAMHVQ